MSPHETPWHALAVKSVLEQLGTRQEGLLEDEVKKRLERFGPNILPSPSRLGAARIFARQFRTPFVYVLLPAAAVTLWLGDAVDAAVILGAVALNIGFGFFQEWRADRALEALKEALHHEAAVVRAGKAGIIAHEHVVPGDILLLSEGVRIAADGRVIEALNLETNEAVLTGEALPEGKRAEEVQVGAPLPSRTDMVYAGTVVTRGQGRAAVIATATSTEFGKIAATVSGMQEESTPLQDRLRSFARWMAWAVLAIGCGVFVLGILRGIALEEIFTTAVAVAVAAIPEGLIVAVTMILALGMMRLLRRKALVRALPAAETLGSVTVICVDKTGTVTEGVMHVQDLITDDGPATHEMLLTIAAFANEAHVSGDEVLGEPTDAALLRAALAAGLRSRVEERASRIKDLLPFESNNQFMAALVADDLRGDAIYLKGAAEKILGACSRVLAKGEEKAFEEEQLRALLRRHDELSAKGLRVLAFAYRKVRHPIVHIRDLDPLLEDFTFVGFIAITDPMRAGVREAVAEARAAGVRVSVITGDYILTAKNIAGELGLPADDAHIMDGETLATLDDEALQKRVGHVNVWARILPHQKLRIVEALQKRGEAVAMTGDGVNDAPALKKADIGIAVGTGTDIAKETADLVILDNNFATIVAAIEEGRVIFDNIRKVMLFLLFDSFSEIVLIGGALVFGAASLPILAGQILWVNLVADSLPAFALAFEPGERDIMRKPPRNPKEPLLNRELLVLIFGVGLVTDILLLGVFFWLSHIGWGEARIQTLMFAALGFASLVTVFALRGLRTPLWRMSPFENKYLLGAIGAGLLVMVAGVYSPVLQLLLRTVSLGVQEWGIVAGIGFANILGIELVKFVARFAREAK